MWGKELLEKGIRWQIGNGESVKVYGDNWVPDDVCLKIRSPLSLAVDTRAAELLTPSRQWNEALLQKQFSQHEVNLILTIPICLSDRVSWHFEKNGLYSVKSGYRLGL